MFISYTKRFLSGSSSDIRIYKASSPRIWLFVQSKHQSMDPCSLRESRMVNSYFSWFLEQLLRFLAQRFSVEEKGQRFGG